MAAKKKEEFAPDLRRLKTINLVQMLVKVMVRRIVYKCEERASRSRDGLDSVAGALDDIRLDVDMIASKLDTITAMPHPYGRQMLIEQIPQLLAEMHSARKKNERARQAISAGGASREVIDSNG